MTYAVIDAPGNHADMIRVHSIHRNQDAALKRAREHRSRVVAGCNRKPGSRVHLRTMIRHIYKGQWSIIGE